MSSNDTLARLAQVIDARRGGDPDKSYVARLFSKGGDAILKKIGEEATETVMAGKDGDARRSSTRWPTCGSIRCCCWRNTG
jgi:phosphoribosyl-ATP pyrophosphohydrolase